MYNYGDNIWVKSISRNIKKNFHEEGEEGVKYTQNWPRGLWMTPIEKKLCHGTSFM